ncbi:hypothetical protein KR100_04200 [Synechococcus sp. KORDI-100]|nr:hypothetical protein KR100_04200 [Synechococcus sp. KORDI-100]
MTMFIDYLREMRRALVGKVSGIPVGLIVLMGQGPKNLSGLIFAMPLLINLKVPVAMSAE